MAEGQSTGECDPPNRSASRNGEPVSQQGGAEHASRPLHPAIPASLTANGAPFPGAKLRFTDPHGGELLPVFADPALRQPLENPVPADAAGRLPAVYLDPARTYEVAVLTSGGAIAFAHLASAGSAAAVPPDDAGLFIGLRQVAVPAGIARIRTEGWSVPGLGAGDYVADALASPALAAAHPRFCVRTANGRVFRLADSAGMITAEQGGAKGDPRATFRINDQEAFQAAVAYAAATGIERIGLAQAHYTLCCPLRRGDPADQHHADGHPIVIAADKRIHFLGLGPQRTRLSFRMPDGATFEGTRPGRNFQIVGGKVWRGSGFFVRTRPRPPGQGRVPDGRRSGLTLEHLAIDGGTRISSSMKLGADPRDGTGWDMTHKGVWVEADGFGGDVTIRDCEMSGWRGETVYCANDFAATAVIRNSSFSQSNGQGLNFNGCAVDVDGCTISDCWLGIEGWFGIRGGRILRTAITRCGIAGKGGGAFSLGGTLDFWRPHAPGKVRRRPDADENPVGTIDITCTDCKRGFLGWWVRGRLRLVDSPVLIGEPYNSADGARGVDLDVELVTDREPASSVRVLGGQGKRGDRLTEDVTLRVSVSRTARAAAAGIAPPVPVEWMGSFGPNVRVQLKGLKTQPPRAVGETPDYPPKVS
jgi:hypothetical protein